VTFRRMLDRTITVQRRVVTGTDARGNDIIGNGPATAGVHAARELLEASEDLDGQDAQTRVYRYFLEPTVAGVALAITGYDRIVDTDGTFEIRALPDTLLRRRRPRVHHLEAVAYEHKG